MIVLLCFYPDHHINFESRMKLVDLNNYIYLCREGIKIIGRGVKKNFSGQKNQQKRLSSSTTPTLKVSTETPGMPNTCQASYVDLITPTGKENPRIFLECQMFLIRGVTQLMEIIFSKQQKKIKMLLKSVLHPCFLQFQTLL